MTFVKICCPVLPGVYERRNGLAKVGRMNRTFA